MTNYEIYYYENGHKLTVGTFATIEQARNAIVNIIDSRLGSLCDDDFEGRGNLESLRARALEGAEDECEYRLSHCGILVYDVDNDGYLSLDSDRSKTYYLTRVLV